MKTRNLCAVALLTFASAASVVNAMPNRNVLDETTEPWLSLFRSGEPAVRTAAGKAMADLVRRQPAAANDLVRAMAAEENVSVAADHERVLVSLAKESPAAVSALIRLIRARETNYRARNFSVKVLSQVGPAAATPEFVEALGEKYCPVPGAYLRVMRSLGKDAIPILTAGFRHSDPTIRSKTTIALRILGRTDPVIQKLFDGLQAEQPLLQKVREGTRDERIHAVAALAELAKTTPGTATALVNALRNVPDMEVRAEAERRLISLGRESPEVVAALMAEIRNMDNYRLRGLALKVLPKVGATLNCQAAIEALGDRYCPVPYMMRRILVNAGADAMPMLQAARQHSNPDIRTAAENILRQLPKPAVVGG